MTLGNDSTFFTCHPPLFAWLQAQEACGPLEIDNALSMVRDLEKNIQEAKVSAEEGKLKPLPGESVSLLNTPGLVPDELVTSFYLTRL